MISVDYAVFIERNPISLLSRSSLMIGNFASKFQGTLHVISEQQSVAAGAPAKVNMLYYRHLYKPIQRDKGTSRY